MSTDSPPESSVYRVTLFFGPEPVDGRADAYTCVFNVKKRSWKAGVQVSVEVGLNQLASIREALHLADRLAPAFEIMAQEDRPSYEGRLEDFFVQAVCWCKLDLRLRAGLVQENQRIQASELVPELMHTVMDRKEYVFSYILTELDLGPYSPSSSSS